MPINFGMLSNIQQHMPPMAQNAGIQSGVIAQGSAPQMDSGGGGGDEGGDSGGGIGDLLGGLMGLFKGLSGGGGGGGGMDMPKMDIPDPKLPIENIGFHNGYSMSTPQMPNIPRPSLSGQSPNFPMFASNGTISSPMSGSPFAQMRSDFPQSSNPYYTTALNQLGQSEGNPVLKSYLQQANPGLDPSKTPWCAGFVGSVLGANGVKGTGSLAARSYLNFGTPTKSPTYGDIVVLSRGGDPANGHVGFYSGMDKNGNVMVLGGNQGNQVSFKSFPSDRVLGYRHPPSADQVQGFAQQNGLSHPQQITDLTTKPPTSPLGHSIMNGGLQQPNQQPFSQMNPVGGNQSPSQPSLLPQSLKQNPIQPMGQSPMTSPLGQTGSPMGQQMGQSPPSSLLPTTLKQNPFQSIGQPPVSSLGQMGSPMSTGMQTGQNTQPPLLPLSLKQNPMQSINQSPLGQTTSPLGQIGSRLSPPSPPLKNSSDPFGQAFNKISPNGATPIPNLSGTGPGINGGTPIPGSTFDTKTGLNNFINNKYNSPGFAPLSEPLDNISPSQTITSPLSSSGFTHMPLNQIQ